MKLIFVYNAGSGFFNVATDMAHKIFSPATYPCSLCDLTYGIFKIRPEWADFIEHAPVPFEFLHKDEFLTAYPDLNAFPLPVVLALQNGQVLELIPAHTLQILQTVSALKELVLEKLQLISAPVGSIANTATGQRPAQP